MMDVKRLLALGAVFLLVAMKVSGEGLPNVAQGQIQRLANFESKWVIARHIDVWLPTEYNEQKEYAVLYMHDGGMLFDSRLTWNQQEWGVDETASQLMAEKLVSEFIVVGIHNGGKLRHSEYFPQKPFLLLNAQQQNFAYKITRDNEKLFATPIQSDNYLRFLVGELKPYIDNNFSVYRGREHTFIMGSSMGGLISLYAISEYPDIFGGAACLSTHWPGIMSMDNNPIPEAFYRYFDNMLPSPQKHRIYFDHGTATLDAFYPPLQKEVDKIMLAHGYNKKNWQTRVFPGAEHNEQAWQVRLAIPFKFLLGVQP